MEVTSPETNRSIVSNTLIATGLAGSCFSVILFGAALTNFFMFLILVGCLCSPGVWFASNWRRIPLSVWIGLAYFCWMGLSVFWSAASFDSAMLVLKKHRIFLLMPLFLIGLMCLPSVKVFKKAIFTALVISSLVSVALWQGWVSIEGAHLSLKNRIFFSLTTAFLFFWSLVLFWTSQNSLYKLWFGAVCFLAGFTLFFVEIGRTGYLVTLVLSALLVWWKVRTVSLRLLAIIGVGTLAYIGYALDTSFSARVDQSIANTIAYFEVGASSSIGMRLEFYRLAIVGWADAPMIGHGSGSYRELIADYQHPERPWGVGLNPHNQYLLSLFEGGLVSLLLFSGFLLRWAYESINSQDLVYAGLVATTGATCLVNSSFLDNGDSHFIWIMWMLLLVPMLSKHSSPPQAAS